MRRGVAMVVGLAALVACGGRTALNGDGGADGGGEVADGGSVPEVMDVPEVSDEVGELDAGEPADRPDGRCIAGAYSRDGACMCDFRVPDLCPDRCVDLAADEENCGVCGHACGPTSGCVAGVCGPEAAQIVRASGACGAIDLAIARGTLFWTEKQGFVKSLAPGASEPTMLAAGEGRPKMLVASDRPAGTVLFWVNATDKTVRRASVPGVPETLATSATEIDGLAVSSDGASVYYSTRPSAIMRVPAAGGAPVLMVRDLFNGWPGALAVVGDQIAFATQMDGDILLAKLMPNGGAVCGLIAPTGNLDQSTCRRIGSSMGIRDNQHVTSASGHFCWSDYGQISMLGAAPFGEMVATSDQGTVLGMATTPTTIYFSDSMGFLWRTPAVVNSTAVQIARGQKEPRSVVLDDERVYWSTADCAIRYTKR